MVWEETHRSPPAVFNRSLILQFADCMTALKPHFIQVLVFSNFNHQPLGQGVDDGNPHTVQPTAGFIGVAAKFTARMQRGHNDLQCRLVFVFGMLVNRNAPTIVADSQRAIG